ncbi:MAG: rRNA pseudouridine synthase [Gammaproteobacteria bacterium]|jgi:23S rRNA pseudouridine2605 synthase|nr:rRNA pseudouridine synthase [Gammaproteobacteria bacterium]
MIRIQKFLANHALMSRRAADQAVRDSRVKINDQKAVPGQVVESGDEVFLDGKQIVPRKIESKLMLYHKPVGRICSMAESEMPRSIWQDFPKLGAGKWISVGRLDINSSGLMLITTDGELANRLMHPSSNIERVYKVRAFGKVTDDMLEKMKTGVRLDDGLACFKKVKLLESSNKDKLNVWFEVTVTSGRYRMVRRVFESLGLTVNRLIRLRYGPLILPAELPLGRCISLSEEDVNALNQYIKRFIK